MFTLTTPVAFIIFNRPDTTERVFAEIAKAKPTKLLVVADGPRQHKEGEAEKVKATRAIIDRVDWPCEVLTNYSEVNLGCKVRVSSGIDWVFELVEEAIILEDDCLPDPTFFRFCQEMLERYRNDQRIGMISGDNFQFGRTYNDESYYFSKYMHIWGWATWRRAWENYDVSMKSWPYAAANKLLKSSFPSKSEALFWEKNFEKTYNNKIDTWDFQWFYTLITQNQLSVLPSINLISNIGFGADATHTQSINKLSEMKVNSLTFPTNEPHLLIANYIADTNTAYNLHFKFSIFKYCLNGLLYFFDINTISKIKAFKNKVYGLLTN